jgi:hypothetical protein
VSVREDTDAGLLNAHAEDELATSEPDRGGTDMETKKVARLVQPIGSSTANHAPIPRASGKARSVRMARATWLGRAVVAVASSVAVIAISIAPMAAASSLRRDGWTVTNNAVNAELGRLHETDGIAVGTMLGMENFLRDFPATA